MRRCAGCGKSIEGMRTGARYCSVACRVAGYVYRRSGKMSEDERADKRPGAEGKQNQTERSANSGNRQKSKQRTKTTFVYAIGWGPNLGCEGIKRYEIREGLNRLFVRPNSYDFIPLPDDWKPEEFRWRFVGIRHDPVRKTIQRKSGYWFVEDGFPEKYYSLRQIENQWRKLQAEPGFKLESDADTWDDVLNMLDGSVESRRRAKELLGVKPNATPADVHRAYRKKAVEHHPDHGGDAKVFAQISAAYELLTRPS